LNKFPGLLERRTSEQKVERGGWNRCESFFVCSRERRGEELAEERERELT